jgi:hypothetical protein
MMPSRTAAQKASSRASGGLARGADTSVFNLEGGWCGLGRVEKEGSVVRGKAEDHVFDVDSLAVRGPAFLLEEPD